MMSMLAFYMDDHFRDSLAGRKRVFQLLTCSFDEYLELSDKGELKEEKARLHAEPPYAIEAKFDKVQANPAKYKKFTETYPEIPLSFVWLSPFDENTFFQHPLV